MTEEKSNDFTVTLKVEDVMTTEIITIDENASVKEAAEIMNLNEISCLIAARKGKAVGIITERDLLKRVIVEAKNAKKTKVSEVMSTPPRSRFTRHEFGRCCESDVPEEN